jgi:hypothetical protein
MNVDPLQILHVTIYSKIINEILKNIPTDLNITYIAFLYIAYKILTNNTFEKYFNDFISKIINSNESTMIIPQHKRKYIGWIGGSNKETIQIVYSTKFRALNHYLTNTLNNESGIIVSSMIENIKREFDTYRETEIIDFIMLPSYSNKIKICSKKNIYLEINIDKELNEERNENKTNIKYEKSYTYKLSIPGKDNYYKLDDFMKTCINKYEKDTDDNETQFIFEYVKSKVDDEDRKSIKFLKYPFNSNKFLDKNIFFEGKEKLIEYIDRFDKSNSKYEQEYQDAGVTFKAGILMYGPPGCGKSCSIRGILNRTKRHGILVPWSKIKTCGDLCTILRRPTVNNKEYKLKDVCFIVEDFDANNNNVLKTREKKTLNHVEPTTFDIPKTNADMDKDELIRELEKTKGILELAKATIRNSTEDELTLEFVLNLLDGIVELHDAMFIFTTNHLEDIDPAFLRPGRIDYILEFKKATVKIIREMVEYRFRSYGINMDGYQTYFENMHDYFLSPAEVQNICFKYSAENIEECLTEIIDKCKKSYIL